MSRAASACAIALVVAALPATAPASAATFTVSNYSDSGPGSLRQAILDSNSNPGADAIEIALVGASPYVIKPTGQVLPPLVGPVIVRGASRAGATAPLVILDGSGLVRPRTPEDCPGATVTYDLATNRWERANSVGTGANVRGYFGAGLMVLDSHDVEIANLEIRNFCIGVAVVRSNGVNIHDVVLRDAHGAAGAIFTGDDGAGGVTPLSFNNRLVNSQLIDNGDGFEFTRGARDSVFQGNAVRLTQPLPINGNAIEFAQAGDNNQVIGNTFSRYVDTAVTVSGNKHVFRDNTFLDNAGPGMRVSGSAVVITGNRFTNTGGVAIVVAGSGSTVATNTFTGNGGVGVQVTGQNITVSKNVIVGAKGLAIDLDPAGANVNDEAAACSDQLPDCDTGPNGSQNTPVLAAASRWTGRGMVVTGSLSSRPNQIYTIELFASRAASTATTVVTPPATGRRGAGPGAGPGGAAAAADGAGRGGQGAGGPGRGGAPAVPITATATATPTGDGEKYLATVAVTTDAMGKGRFTVTLPAADPFMESRTGVYLSATATDSTGATSEYSPALAITRGN